MNDRLTKCEVCGKSIASHVCPKCGINVCEADYNHKTNLCKNCNKGKVL